MSSGNQWETQQYTTADICEMYGLSASGLRFMENKGLIAPERDCANRYRIFTLTECSRIFIARILRQYGFSLDESIDMMRGTSPDEYLTLLKERKAALEAEICHKQNLLTALQRTVSKTEKLKAPRQCKMVMSPAMLRLRLLSKKRSASCANADDFQQWFSALPFTAASILIGRASLCDPVPKTEGQLGFIIEMEEAGRHGLAANPHTSIIPSQRCLYTQIELSEDLHDLGDALRPAMEAMRGMRLRPDGDAFTRMLGCMDMGRGMRRLDEVWFPVEPA